MKHDLFADLYLGPDLSSHPPARPTRSALTVERHADGTRTLAYQGRTLGHYERVRARWGAPPHWRAVTPAGALLSAASERGARRALLENAL